ncbi:MAG TPA: hypothetical protein VKD90_23275, partial [Gemmataceae bacterium]|nr:hypothetical protein [Gemmataceae bacterium]
PAILGALSRAYAQVGMLTDAQWGALPWVCKARALLYAERLRQRDPASPWGAWHRGYAAALAGLHSAALADFHAADGLRAKAPGDPPVPTWVTLAAALCRFDSAHLKTAFSDERFGDIARVFHFLTVESAGSRALALQAGQALVLKNPECFRVYDALVSLGIGVRAAEAHRAFGDSFPRRVREAPGIPASVSEALAKSPSEPDLVRRLVEAGQVKDDRNEPSWAVLGRYAQEARMVQVAGRMRYLREDLGAPADDFFEESRPLVAGHPLFPYLESLLIDPAASPREHEAKLRAARTTELTYRQLGFLGAHQRLGRDQFVRSTGVAENHGDMLYYDLSLALRLHPPERNTSQFARRMLGVSSFAPLARAAAIVHDPAVPASYLAGWEREAQHPEVFEALAVRAFREARFDDQQRHLQQAIAASPELNTYRILAELRKADGDIDGWLAALNEFLKGPDAGLDHARVRVELAEYFLSKKDYPRALAYAEPATQSEASWALLCAVRCAEAAGDWAKAEQWAKRVAERFPEFAHVWFYWCHRTGRGDVKAAANSVEEYLKKSATRPSPQDLILAGAYRELTGQPALAPALYMTAYERTRADPLILAAATVCDSLGDADGRSRATSLLPETSPYASLVTLVATALSEGEKSIPDKERLTRMLERLPRGLRETGCYYAGMLLRKRGETELAKKLLTQALEDSEPKHRLTPTLAAVALRDMEKKK